MADDMMNIMYSLFSGLVETLRLWVGNFPFWTEFQQVSLQPVFGPPKRVSSTVNCYTSGQSETNWKIPTPSHTCIRFFSVLNSLQHVDMFNNIVSYFVCFLSTLLSCNTHHIIAIFWSCLRRALQDMAQPSQCLCSVVRVRWDLQANSFVQVRWP